MSLFALLLSFAFVIFAFFLSQAFKLGLGRDLLITEYSSDHPIINCWVYP